MIEETKYNKIKENLNIMNIFGNSFFMIDSHKTLKLNSIRAQKFALYKNYHSHILNTD